MMQTFEEWFMTNKGWKVYHPFSNRDLESAYEAGWNACRDKWGGLEYRDTATDEMLR